MMAGGAAPAFRRQAALRPNAKRMRAFDLVGLLPQPKIRDFRPGAPTFLALRTQACSPRCVIAGALSPHMSLKARDVPKGRCPLTSTGALPLHPARGIMPLDPLFLYNNAPSVAATPAALGAISYYKKAREREGIIPSQRGVGELFPHKGRYPAKCGRLSRRSF